MRVLVLGGTGMLGHMACRVFSRHFEVSASSKSPLDDNNKMPLFLPKAACFGGVDATDTDRLRQLIRDTKPEVILNCVGIIKQKKAAKDAITSIKINSLFPHELSEVASEHSAKVIHLSTDCIF